MEKKSAFNDLRVIGILVLMCIGISLLTSWALKGQDVMYYYVLMPIMACVVFTTFYLTMGLCQGWRALHFKMILGMPVRLFLNYLMVVIIISFAAYLGNNSYTEFPEDIIRFKLFLFNLCLGTIASLIAWFPVVKNSTAKADEYKIRVELKRKGWTQEKIEEEIKKFKDLDLV